MKKLEDKTALITGGGSGIGAAIARRFVEEGARVCVAGRRQAALDDVVRALPPDSAVSICGDVSCEDDIDVMIAKAVDFGGKLDILVNNAAMEVPGTVADIETDLWRKALDTNLTGPFLLMKKSIPHMIQNGGGSIINVASLAGLRSIPAGAAYCSTKAGLIMLTRQAALDYGPLKIRCNAVCPGGVRTDMLERSVGPLAEKLGTDVDGFMAYFSSMVPMRRVALPEEISGLCSYLASDDSTYMTGAVLVIDGGAAVVDISGAAITRLLEGRA